MKKIIFVDDDPTIQDVVNLVLEDEYEVQFLSSGESLYSDQYTKPDLFLLDRQLAGTDGLDICKYLKSQSATMDIPVIMISAFPDIINSAREAGADDAIVKPFLIRELRHLIALHIR